MVIFDLKSWRPMFAILRLSTNIFPAAASMILNNARVMDDLPAPVRPTTPIYMEAM